MTPEERDVVRCAYRWADGRDGSSIELANAVRAARMAEARAASVAVDARKAMHRAAMKAMKEPNP